MVNQDALNQRLNNVPKVFIDITSLGEHKKRVEMRWAIIVEIFHSGKVTFSQLQKTFGFSERELRSLLVPIIQNYIYQTEENGEYVYQPYEPGQDFINGFFEIISKKIDKDNKVIFDQIPERFMMMEMESFI